MIDVNATVLPLGRRVVLSGFVASIHSASAEDGSWVRGVLSLADGTGVPFVGSPFLRMRPGCSVRLTGVREDSPQYGTQFRIVDCLRVSLPHTDAGMTTYLAENLPGCGPARAKRIVQVLGRASVDVVLSEPARLRSLFPGRVGTQLAFAAERLAEAVASDRAALDLSVRLHSAGVTPAIARRVLSYFRTAEAAEIVLLRRPYRLLDVPDIGWKRADRIARQLGVAPDAPERLEAALGAALDCAMTEGHSAQTEGALLEAAAHLVGGGIPEPSWQSALREAEDGASLVRDGRLLYRPAALEAEWTIAERLQRLISAAPALSQQERETVAGIIASGGLVDEQQQAIWTALANGVSVLTGGPGTGKTTTTRTFVRCCVAIGRDVRIAAPSGKAASRATEVTGVTAETVHRMLGGPPGGVATNTLTARVLVVDELSMCSTPLLGWLLANVDPSRTQNLLLVGDPDQLPSVDHGEVLRDLISSGVIPVSPLRTVHRQASNSGIVRNAHALMADHLFPVGTGDDFVVLDVTSGSRDPASEQRRSVKLLLEQLRMFRQTGVPVERDVQVLSPMRRGPLGVDALNPTLQNELNPLGEVGPFIGGKVRVRAGDRVLQVRNDYGACDGGLFNGEQGTVVSVDVDRWSARVDFGSGRVVTLDGVRLLNLRLAWAMTCHRSQGSEFPIVLLLYHDCFGPMLDRRVLYTALTRAKRKFVLIGTDSALTYTKRGVETRLTRQTGLAAALKRAFLPLEEPTPPPTNTPEEARAGL